MVNFEVEAARLAPLVPRGTELDLWNGRALVSVVGFRFLDTRVWGLRFPLHTDFDEVNLRFYVRRDVGLERRRGVVFIREVVPRAAISWLARTLYNEPYVTAPMDHQLDPSHEAPSARYRWRLGGRWHEVGVSGVGEANTPASGSELEFVIEHYWGYSRQRGGGTVEYRVKHPPWRVWPAENVHLDLDGGAAYGSEWSDPLSRAPVSALLAEGSKIEVYPGRAIA